jgi:FxsC-like protein
MSSGEPGISDAVNPEIRPYFFLSYARTPKRDPSDRANPDRWVHKLYRDLCDEILQMTDVQPAEAGFMDVENKLGAEWSPELMNAIKNCRVFVPLYSRRYFESDNCGREWFAFARREVIHRARGGERIDAIVPILWTGLDRDRMPPVAQKLQYAHPELGEKYCADGFYGLIKLRNHRAAYQLAVHRLAQRIIELGDMSVAYADHDVQRMELKDFESLQSAFGPASARRTGDCRLRISVLAHDTSALPRGRARRYYGETPRSWSPYHPYPQPVAEYSLELIMKCMDMDCDPVIEAFEVAELNDDGLVPPGICLVDAWVVMSDSYRERLRQLNEMTAPWLSVVIPWNDDDQEFSEHGELLRVKLVELLGNKLSSVPRRCRMAAEGIPTIEDLGFLLPEMAMMMLKRYHHRNAPALPAVTSRPRLREALPSDPGGFR